jgi:hypothetical protein
MRAGLIHIGYHSKPEFLVIGAQKSGTNAITYYLTAHPNVVRARKKEIHFFDSDLQYNKGIDWYHAHFPLPHKMKPNSKCFEASPGYLYYAKSAERIYSYNPQLRLIVLLRNPVERAYSQWNMYRVLLEERPNNLYLLTRESDMAVRKWFDEILSKRMIPPFDQEVRKEIEQFIGNDSIPEPSYVRRGIYCEQLHRFLRYFKREQILIIESKHLKTDPGPVLSRIIQFLDLPEFQWQENRLGLRHVRQYKEPMPGNTRELLSEFYRPYNQKLYQLLGRDLGWQ